MLTAEAQIDGTTDGEDFLKQIMEFESANQGLIAFFSLFI